MQAKISLHAHDRSVRRAGVGLSTLRTILDDDTLHVVVYKECRKPRLYFRSDGEFKRRGKKRVIAHKLFFSWESGGWLVAIQDTQDGMVITVQQVWMHQHQRHITGEHLLQALAANCRQITHVRGGS